MDVARIALGGLQAAETLLEKSANRLATAKPAIGEVDLTADIVGVLSAREQFQANARVMRAADEMQKNLIDLLA